MINAAYFLERAEQCFRLSKTDGIAADAASELNELGQDFMAKAVYLDTLTKRVKEVPATLPDAHVRAPRPNA